MTAQPLRNDNVYPLRMEDAIGVGDVQPENIPPASSTIAGALAINEEAAKPKKPRKRKSATGRKRGRPVKAKAPAEEPVTETPRTTVNMLSSAGDAGPRMWWRRINSDGWLIIAAVAAMLALGSVRPFLTGVLKP